MAADNSCNYLHSTVGRTRPVEIPELFFSPCLGSMCRVPDVGPGYTDTGSGRSAPIMLDPRSRQLDGNWSYVCCSSAISL